jgi:hypothetical protein
MQHKNFSLGLGLVLTAGMVLAGCTSKTSPGPVTAPGSTTQGGAMKAEEKKGDTSMTGMISASGDNYLITAAGKAPKGLDSYAVDLKQYVGKTVTVTGQFSGDTLFVSKVE